MKGAVTSHRENCLHQARVYLQQARAFRLRGSEFSVTLLEWAGNARRRATEWRAPETVCQLDMFA